MLRKLARDTEEEKPFPSLSQLHPLQPNIHQPFSENQADTHTEPYIDNLRRNTFSMFFAFTPRSLISINPPA
jgi:hypothetical protein